MINDAKALKSMKLYLSPNRSTKYVTEPCPRLINKIDGGEKGGGEHAEFIPAICVFLDLNF